MGKSSKQTVGYKYFAGLQVALGNCIERILNINPDKRGWIFTKPEEIDQLKTGDTSIAVNKPNIFGGDKQEGGWVGTIDIHTGKPSALRQNEYLAEQDSSLVSSFPYLSHLVFRGPSLDKGFQLVSMSGMLKDVLYWPKRTRIKDDGSEQWYKIRSTDYAVVCEVYETIEYPNFVLTDTNGTQYYGSGENRASLTPEDSLVYFLSKDNTKQDSVGGTFVGFGENSETGADLSISSACVKMGIETTNQGFITIYGSGSYWATSPLTMIYYGNAECVSYYSLETNREVIPNDGRVRVDFEWSATFKSESEVNEFGVIFFVSGAQVSENGSFKDLFLTAYMNVQRQKEISKKNTDGIDINPIHKIREIITDDTAMNKPESMINDENFKNAADRIFEESLGVSGAFTEKSCKEAIDELLYHIEAGIRVNRQTGLYEIVLFRDDLLDLDNAQLFDKSNIKTFSIETANIDDVINSVNVNYYDRENIKDSSFSLDELGSILSNQSNAETLDFPYFMNRRNAELVGNWKLKQLSTPTRKGTFTTGKYDARKINRYDVVKLTWHNQNMIEVPIRIMKIGLGDGIDNTVTLDWVEVIPYSSINYPSINVDQSTSVVLSPQPNESIVFEMPYFEAVQRFGQTQVDNELSNNPDLGYLMVATKRPQNNSINALLFTDNGTGYQQASIVDYCPVVQLDQNISYLDTSFAVKNVASISQAEVGTLILCDDELMLYQSYDANTKILTVKRAALDTHPKTHSQDAVFYFYDSFNAFDSEQYVLSEVVDAKVLTTTPSSVLDISAAPELELEFNARMIRPYPPADVKLNSNYFIESMINTGDLVVTWVDRNRLQQTGGNVLSWVDGGVTIESGTTYSIELSSESTVISAVSNITANTHTFDKSTLVPNKAHTLKLWSVRDGYNSYQIFEHEFFVEAIEITLTATATKTNVSGSTVPSAVMDVVVDETLTANMKWNGTSIKGKAEAGATITIEVNT